MIVYTWYFWNYIWSLLHTHACLLFEDFNIWIILKFFNTFSSICLLLKTFNFKDLNYSAQIFEDFKCWKLHFFLTSIYNFNLKLWRFLFWRLHILKTWSYEYFDFYETYFFEIHHIPSSDPDNYISKSSIDGPATTPHS